MILFYLLIIQLTVSNYNIIAWKIGKRGKTSHEHKNVCLRRLLVQACIVN